MASIIESLIPSVHDMLSLREALSKIAHCEKSLRTGGPCSVVENFDVIYTCYHYIKDLKEDTIGELLNYLIKGMQLLESELKKVLGERGGEQQHQRVTYLNALKIFTFLTVEFTNFLERKHLKSKEDELMPVSGKAKAGGKKAGSKKTGGADISLTGDSSGAYDWGEVREKLLECISKLLLLNIQKLWDPPIAEEQFVIMITNLCYKLMENLPNQSLRQQQRKTLKDLLCHILGIMIKKYNHSYGACVMIIQTLPHYEHLSTLYADLIQTCVAELGYESILAEILREFRHTILSGAGANAATTNNNKEKDNPNNKFYSQFLIDLVDRLPQHLMPYISLIQDFLDDDSYLMRNAVLYIYGELCVRVLNAEATEKDLKLKQIRNELLDTLIEHVHDSNALTRSKTLQIWRSMAEHKAVPLNYISEVMKRCIGRMDDVASSVRKSAFQLLCDFIRNNPYGIRSIEMSQDEVKNELDKEESVLNQMKEESDKLIEEINRQLEENSAKSQKSSESEEMETDETAANKTMTEAAGSDENDVKAQAEKQKHQEKIMVQTCKVNFLRDMMSFVNQIDEAMPKITRLLFSKTQTDVLEVISFFVTCYEHGFNDMLVGIRKMLGLVFNSEKPIKDAVINAYKRLYLKADGSDPDTATAASVQVAKQLIKLVNDLTICERQALEELIGEFVISNELNNSVIKILWEYFATPETTSPRMRLNAIILLGMVIRRLPAKGRANLEVLIDFGLIQKESGEKFNDYEMLIFKETCLTLSHITPDASTKQLTQLDTNHAGSTADIATGKKKKGKSGGENKDDTMVGENGEATQRRLQYTIQPFKLPNNHQVYERISQTIVSQFENMDTDHWLPMCEQAMACIFKTADGPFGIVEDIFIKLVEKLPFKSIFHTESLSQRVQQLPPVPLFNSDAESGTQSNISNATVTQTNLLARFFNFVGVVATKFLIFLNQIVVCELKRRKMYKENVEKKDSAAVKAKAAKDRRRSMKLKNMRKSINPGSLDLEEEMGLQGAEAEDVEQMFIENLLDLKVANGHQDSLIANILPVCVNILKDPIKYSNQHLQLACSMCLIRMMILSQVICNENLQLIFTLMKKSANPMVRSHLILGIGDLVYRFPNALEPWTSHLYLPLRDTRSPEVRMNTIRVLSHLILKEMIKIKGQIYEIALCIIDSDQKISSLAKVFFNELAQRNNGLVIYNAMPDMISQLSGGGGGENIKNSQDHLSARVISEESFRSIITYLFTFIKRDKQCETLIEKLCMSLREVHREERKTRDIVFCLTKIQLNDSGIKKLKETFKMYAEKLTIPAVYDMFKQMIKNARKATNLKNESKQLLDELDKQMDEVKQRGVEDQANNQDAEMKTDTEKQDDMKDEEEEMPSPKKTQRQSVVKTNARSNQSRSSRNVSVMKKKGASGKSAKSKNLPTRSSRRGRVVDSSSDEDNQDDDKEESDEASGDESD